MERRGRELEKGGERRVVSLGEVAISLAAGGRWVVGRWVWVWVWAGGGVGDVMQPTRCDGLPALGSNERVSLSRRLGKGDKLYVPSSVS